MPRPKALVPALRYHVSGQSICEINGTTYYLGKADSPESLARYAVLIREHQTNGLKVPGWITSETLKGLARSLLPTPEKVDKSEEPITVAHVTAAYREHVKVRYAHSLSEKNRLLQVCDILDKEAKQLEADKFGPRTIPETRIVAG